MKHDTPAVGPTKIAGASPTSHAFISQNLKIRYLDWGNHGAPILILQHGNRDHAHSWDFIAQVLSKDWHVIVPDLRGHGDSDWSPDGVYSVAFYLYDFVQMIQQVSRNPVYIVAHSLGGYIATRYAALYPHMLKKLVVIEGVGMPPEVAQYIAAHQIDEIWRNWIDERQKIEHKKRSKYKTVEDAVRRMMKENPHLTAEQAAHFTHHGVVANDDGTWSWKFDDYVRSMTPIDFTEEQLRYLYRQISCPVLLMRGEESWGADPALDGTVDYFQNARFVSFSKSGHWPQHNQPKQFISELQKFLS